MFPYEQKQKVLAKLTNARNELDALALSVPVARYNPVLLRDARRGGLGVMVDDSNRVIYQMQGVQ